MITSFLNNYLPGRSKISNENYLQVIQKSITLENIGFKNVKMGRKRKKMITPSPESRKTKLANNLKFNQRYISYIGQTSFLAWPTDFKNHDQVYYS